MGEGDAAFRLDGLVGLVTGGTRGIGAAIAAEFAAAGARVIVTGRNGEQAVAAARALGGDAAGFAYDAAEPGGAEALAAAVAQRFGRLDLLVNNAAILKPHRIDKVSGEEIDLIFATNVRSPLLLCRHLHPLLAGSTAGAVVNIGAAGGHVPMAGIGAYSASKAALINLTRTLAKEWAPDGIRVNALTPGSVATDMILPRDPERRARFVAEMGETNLMKRIAAPIEIARAVRFLASGAASFITGQVLIADGGLLA
ncbi:SDR family NAD(P)-dependent oxidoreductase [Flavisphingomonas formosensis]|uniref:SDR family NAD(P)-dependent oxidoreductase n=1 Tax=Flavisphingomonas formosensis TaxID=861534 RepID=UPI0012FA65F6|nr:SDR family oxidoreductase [Sphingomonas formosensis]